MRIVPISAGTAAAGLCIFESIKPDLVQTDKAGLGRFDEATIQPGTVPED
jgi:hypothetical protein